MAQPSSYIENWGGDYNFVVSVLNKGYDESRLTFSQRTSVLSLIF